MSSGGSGGWTSTNTPPSQEHEEKLSLSASIVYREMPYHYLRRVSQEGEPLVVSSMEGSILQNDTIHEDDDEGETQLYNTTEYNRDIVVNMKTTSPTNEDISDTETHILSDDENDLELTQIIDEGGETPIQDEDGDTMHFESTIKQENEDMDVNPSEASTTLNDHSSYTMKLESLATMVQENTHHLSYIEDIHERKEKINWNESMASSVTTMASNYHQSNHEHGNASDVNEEIVHSTIESEVTSDPTAMVRSSNDSTTSVKADLPPLHHGTTQTLQVHTPPRSIENDVDQEMNSEPEERSVIESGPLFLQRRQKNDQVGLITPERKNVYEFNDSQSSITASATKRPYAFLVNDHSQSQNETQATPPDLDILASTTLHAAMDVERYVSPWTRQQQAIEDSSAANYITPPKLIQPSSATTSATTTSRKQKRLKKEGVFSPIPARTEYTKRRVHCFTDVHFYLSGFQEIASKQLISQIKSYGGHVEKRTEDMKKLQGRCYVIATVEASRRPKILYAMACGVPIVHPEWLAACFQARTLVDISRYWIPSGFSWVLRRSIVYVPKHQGTLFNGLRFGMVYDTLDKKRREAQQLVAHVMRFPLEHCGAISVKLDIKRKSIEAGSVDIILSNEYTKLCALAEEHNIPVVRLLWVNECILQQQLVDLKDPNFTPDLYAPDGTLDSRVVEVTLPNEAKQKLCVGEMVFVDLDQRPHHLLYHICQIIRLDEKIDSQLTIHVQLYKRNKKLDPNSQELIPTRKIVLIEPKQIKKKACLISYNDYMKLKYKDNGLFYINSIY